MNYLDLEYQELMNDRDIMMKNGVDPAENKVFVDEARRLYLKYDYIIMLMPEKKAELSEKMGELEKLCKEMKK